jgi:cytochrome c oxidase assembly protein subunit 15
VFSATNFRRFAWALLAWNVLVVVWGGFVRASGSGAGCGSHWPTCNGEVVPHSPQVATIIEFTHRMMSGVALIGVAVLGWWAFRVFGRRHMVRRMAAFSAGFLLLEALLGAGLVLFNYVEKDASIGRVVYLCAHLVNTQLLLATLALTAWYATDRSASELPRPGAVVAALSFVLVVSITGVIAALGDTLFPSTSLAQGMQQDFSETASFLIRLRGLHPLFAVACGVYVLALMMGLMKPDQNPGIRKIARWAALLVFMQLCAGAVNIALLAPVWMQLVHLLLANLVWISLVLLRYQCVNRPQLLPQRSQLIQPKSVSAVR